MKICRICDYSVGAHRSHCPACGAFTIDDISYNYVTVKNIVRAIGARSVEYAHNPQLGRRPSDFHVSDWFALE